MESRDSSDCTRNIYRPFTPEKDVTKKKPPWERLPKATDSKVHGCLDTDFGEFLFHFYTYDKENEYLSSKIYRVCK